MALLAAEEVAELEVEVVNPEALLDVVVALEERRVVELELLLELLLEEGVALELVTVLELLAVEEDAVLEVESAVVDAKLEEDALLEEREVAVLELLLLVDKLVGVVEVAGAEDVLDDVVA